MKYRLESIKDNLPEILNLVYSYWQEADERRNIDDGSIDVDLYLRLEEESIAYILTARDTESKMVGFILYTVTKCSHTGISKASAELLFIEEGYRNGIIAIDLLSKWDEVVPDDAYLFFTLKTEFPHERLVEATGFSHVENVFMKRNRHGSSNSSRSCTDSSAGQ